MVEIYSRIGYVLRENFKTLEQSFLESQIYNETRVWSDSGFAGFSLFFGNFFRRVEKRTDISKNESCKIPTRPKLTTGNSAKVCRSEDIIR